MSYVFIKHINVKYVNHILKLKVMINMFEVEVTNRNDEKSC